MFAEPDHLSDEEILLFLDGEGTHAVASRVRRHLEACWACRTRMAHLESTIQEFVAHHRQQHAAELSDSGGPTALLRARMAQAAETTAAPVHFWRWFRPLAWSTAALLIAAMGTRLLVERSVQQPAASLAVVSPSLATPNPHLTPGVARDVQLREVCALPHEEVVSEVPAALQKQVFAEYGITDARPQDYEVDYLIAPGLGGTNDIHNLWPQPALVSGWNSQRKDALEERLHQMVCSRKLDLETARQAIATNWIAAYQKYCTPDLPAAATEPRRQRPRQYASRRASRPSIPA